MAELDSNEYWDGILKRIRERSIDLDQFDSSVVKLDFRELPELRRDFERLEDPVHIPASAIVRFILKEKSVSERRLDIRFQGGTFINTLHLEHLNFPGYLRFEDCHFKGRLDLRYTNLGRLKFEVCVFDEIVEADVARVEGDVEVIDCKLQQGLVLRAAHVKGRIVVDGCKIGTIGKDKNAGMDFTEGFAIDAAMVRAENGISFRKIDAKSINKSNKKPFNNAKQNNRNCKKYNILFGGIDLNSSVVDGHIQFEGVKIKQCLARSINKSPTDERTSVDLTNGKVNGFLFIRERANFEGKLNIFCASLRLFSISGNSKIVRWKENKEPAIDAEAVRIDTSFTLGGGVIVEGINLSSAEIKGEFQFGGRADSSGDPNTESKREVQNTTASISSCEVEDKRNPIIVSGDLNLTHARIGRLSIEISDWVRCCESKNMVPLFNGCVYGDVITIDGEYSVNEADLRKWFCTIDGSLRKSDSFVKKSIFKTLYSCFFCALKFISSILNKLFYIKSNFKYNPQIHHQLISVLISKGRYEDLYFLEKLATNRSRKLTYSKGMIFFYPFYYIFYIFRWLVRYGRGLGRLLLCSILITWGCAVFYTVSFEGGEFLPSNPLIFNEQVAPLHRVIPDRTEGNIFLLKPFYFQNYTCPSTCGIERGASYPRAEYPSFNPILYSLDVFLPLVDFSQEESWSPVTPAGEITWVWGVVVFQIVFGWIFSGLLIASVSGAVRPRL